MKRLVPLIALACAASFAAPLSASGDASHEAAPFAQAQAAMVKLYGAGGVAGLEGYQSGVYVEAEGVVLTIDSPVLEGDRVALVDAYGDRCEARVVGRDGPTGLAVLVCPESVAPPAVLPLRDDAPPPERAQRVWAFSNAFDIASGDEPVTAQRARVAAVAPMPTATYDPSAPRPAIGAPATGTRVLLLDRVTSNPGAGGGVVVDAAGRLLGVLGAECRSPVTGAWINYATPAAQAAEAVRRVRSGGGATISAGERLDREAIRAVRGLGIVFIPAVSARTPAYVEGIEADSPAALAGVREDDLVVAVAGVTVGTVEAATTALAASVRREGDVEVTLLRDNRLLSLVVRRDAP